MESEQVGADRPPLAFLFAGRFGFDDRFFMVGDLGLRGRWGRLALDVLGKKVAESVNVFSRGGSVLP